MAQMLRADTMGAGAPLFVLAFTSAGCVLLVTAVRARAGLRASAKVPTLVRVWRRTRRLFFLLCLEAVVTLTFWERRELFGDHALVVGLILTLGLALSADVFRTQSSERERRRPAWAGGHGARRRLEWPMWRRVAAVTTGVALTAIGCVQWALSMRAGLYNPIASGLCLTTLAGVGVTLAATGLAGLRRRRRPTRRLRKLKQIFR